MTVSLGRRRALAISLLAVALLLSLVVADARAGIGGSTTLKPDRGTFEGLADMGIAAKAIKPAEDGKAGFRFPITGGSFDVDSTHFVHSGGLKLKQGKKSVAFKKPTMNLSAVAYTVTARVGKRNVVWMNLNFKKAQQVSRYKTTNIKATLAKPGAKLLSKVFDAKFKAGIPLGEITVITKTA